MDLDDLASRRRAGQDVSAALAEIGLSMQGLQRGLQLRDLAATGPLRDDEWEDLVRALVRVLRVRNWPTWRDAELTSDVVIDPAVLRDLVATEVTPLPTYIDAAAREDLLDRLAARALSVNAVTAMESAARARADDASLPLLRDALLAVLDPGIAGVSVTDALTSALFVDVGAGAQDVTMSNRRSRRCRAPSSLLAPTSSFRKHLGHNPDLPAGGLWGNGRLSARRLRRGMAVDGVLRRLAGGRISVLPPRTDVVSDSASGSNCNFTALLGALRDAGSDLTPQLARDQASAYKAQMATADPAALQATDPPIDDLILSDQLAPAQITTRSRSAPATRRIRRAARRAAGFP